MAGPRAANEGQTSGVAGRGEFAERAGGAAPPPRSERNGSDLRRDGVWGGCGSRSSTGRTRCTTSPPGDIRFEGGGPSAPKRDPGPEAGELGAREVS